jgi:hypothetical protein
MASKSTGSGREASGEPNKQHQKGWEMISPQTIIVSDDESQFELSDDESEFELSDDESEVELSDSESEAEVSNGAASPAKPIVRRGKRRR